MAIEEEMKATLGAGIEIMEANPGEQKSSAVHGEVPKEEAVAKSSGALKKPHGTRRLIIVFTRALH
jgi:hypothetical protein